MNHIKRMLSILLAVVMVFGLLVAVPTTAKAASDDPIYVLAGGDFQAGDNGQEDHYYSRINMGNILDKIKETYSTMDGFLFVGDYDGDTHNDSNANAGVAAMMEEVAGRYSNLNHDNSVLIEGNHETGAVTGIDPTGGYEFDGYAVYAINETDYCERQEGKSAQIQTVADNLETWLNNKLGEGYDAPIFVITHVPLAYGTRTYTNGDGLYAKYVFDVLNTAADNGLNIIFLHGHDHAYGADNYLGGEAIYLPVGDKINICVPGDATSWTEETLNFTYMNAGYVGYYNENYYNVNSYEAEKLTMTVFKIENNQVTVERISKDGTYNLKSAGREGFYSNSGTCAGIGLSYNTTVYTSPQTITLQSNNNETAGTNGNWVGVTGTLTEDVTTSNNGWVEIIAPVEGTPEVPGTPASTKYVYTLDTDGTVTDKADSEQGYLIVGSNNAYAMTDSLGDTGVTITDNAITLDAQPDYEWWITSDGKITDGTNYLKFTQSGSFINPKGTVTVVTSESEATAWNIEHDSNGAYKIYAVATYQFIGSTTTEFYLRYSSNGFSVTSSTSNTVRLFSGAEVTTPATEGTPAVPGTNGTYATVTGNLTYTATAGMSKQQALDGLKAQLTGYVYEGMSAPTTETAGTEISYDDLIVEFVETYDGNTAGDYEVKVSYKGKELATAKVIVPATTTYYIAEGNGMYYVDMNTTADNAMAVVKAGITVSSATDAEGTGKTAISDDEVTWTWVDTYNGADSGPYTVDISIDGTSLGTVEVRVNVKYTTGLNGWVEVGESETTGGTHTYTLDTDGIDAGEENKYIIVARNQAYLLDAGSAVAITISSDGKTVTTDSRAYEYYFTGSTSGLITRDGTNTLYQQNWGIHVGNVSDSNLDMFVNNGNGYYRLYDGDGTARSLYYNGSTWTVTSSDHTSSTYTVRLYKYTGSTGGTGGGMQYASLSGNTVYTVDQGTSRAAAMATVKAGITGYISSNADGSNATELADSDLTWTWKNTYVGSVTGSYWVEISYNGVVLGTVEVQVEPGVINNYPEYPDEGAVKVNKTATGIDFQSSGIAQVEISASGVPIKKGVDLIIMLDTSSSMTSHTVTGGTATRAEVLEEALKNLIAQLKTPGDDGQLLDIDVAIADFNGFYGDNHSSSGTAYDRDAEDMMSDGIYYTADSEAQVYTVGKTLDAGAFVAAEDLAESYTLNYTSGTNYDYAMDAIYQMAKAKQEANGNEERDLFIIFMSDGAAMQWNYYHSQGASSLWNSWLTGAWDAGDLTTTNLNCVTHAYYYDEVDHNGDGMLNEHRMANAIKGDPSKTYEVIRKVSDIGTATGEENMYMVPGLGATMFTISFDATTDTNVTEESMDKSIASLASEQTGTTQYYYKVTSADELDAAFNVIGNEVAYAANNARFVDQMGSSFNLQMTPQVYLPTGESDWTNAETITPTIEIISYDIYTKADADAGLIPAGKNIGDRKDTSTTLETITFKMAEAAQDADGNYTGNYNKDEHGNYVEATNGRYKLEVYSDKIGGGTTNILADGTQTGYVKGVIYAKTFLYNTNIFDVAVDGVNIPTGINPDGTTTGSTNVLPSETFYWKLGTVQTSELAMRYYVYLDGSMEGTKEAGSYQTNEFATLYYDNYLGYPCYMDTVSPTTAWKSANVSYAFYLVNEDGEIVVNQTTGQTGSFANKIAITKPVVYEEILLNNLDQISSLNVMAISDDVLPKYYTLYDATYVDGVATDGATYTVQINSNSTGYWKITTVKDKATTYVTQYKVDDPSAYSNALSNDSTGNDYTHTTVWFAVVWKPQAHPDTVVVDYGLPVDIHVLTNDMFGEKGKLAYIGSADDLDNGYDNGVYHDSQPAISSATYTGTYGTAVAYPETGVVRYTLNTMSVNGYDKFAYAVYYDASDDDYDGYYYDTVTVIPATTIYYEDSFLTFAASGTEWVNEGTAVENATQDEDRPGKYSLTDANNIYGYDSVNNGMATYSMGVAKKVRVGTGTYATATFTFAGTGFDVISMTSNTTGTIAVKVTAAEDIAVDGETKYTAGSKVKAIIVDTYYGYTTEMHEIKYQYTNGAWVVTDEKVSTAVEESGTAPDNPTEGTTYTAVEQVWVLAPDVNKSLYQVPVLQIEDLPYGKYNVTITATYGEAYDHTEEDGYWLYLDAIRIYDPANDGAADGTVDTTIESAYAADGEGWPSYKELRSMIIDASSFDNVANDVMDSDMEGLVFIDGDASVGDAQIADYISYGPNNEVYLAPGQRVAFIVQDVTAPAVDEDGNPIYESDGITQKQVSIVDQVHIGLKSADGGTVTYTITNVAKTAGNSVSAGQYYNPRTVTLNTATDMYYDMTDWKGDIIVISNTGDRYGTAGILSITNIKFTYTSDPNAASEPVAAVSVMDLSTYAEAYTGEATVYMTASAAALTVDAVNTMYRAAAAEPEVDEPEADDSEVFEPETGEPEVFEPGQLDVQVSRGKIRVGDRIDVVVRTGDDVSSVTVNDRTAQKRGTDRRTGETIWTVKVTVEEVGDLDIKVVAYDAEGVAGEPVVKTVRVQQKPGFKAGGFKLPWNQD